MEIIDLLGGNPLMKEIEQLILRVPIDGKTYKLAELSDDKLEAPLKKL